MLHLSKNCNLKLAQSSIVTSNIFSDSRCNRGWPSQTASTAVDQQFIHSCIHSGYFYSASSSALPLRGAPDYSTDTVSEYHAEAHRQLQVKDLPKVPT